MFIFLINQTYSQVPVIRWDKTIGGINDDNGYSIVSLPDGGFVVTGNSSSLPGGNKTAPSMGGWDYWVIRLDSTGKLIWDKSYGGIKDDGFQVTSGIFLPQDKGLLLGGFSNSNPGGNKISPLKSINDIWLIRLDSVGNKVWEKSFGGSNYPSSSTNYLKFLQLKDGNILIGSNITGSGGDISQPSFGYYDYWIIKIDMNANKIWDKRFGGNRDDYLSDVLELKNGDLLLGGYSYSDAGGAKTNPNQGGVGSVYGDYWVVKTDSTGKKIWDRTYGGTQGDYLSSMCKVSDYSILLAGQSSSGIGGNKTSPNYSGVDYWVIKIDTSGGKIFEKTFNYSNGDNLMTIAPLYNKSYLLSGFTHSLSLNDWEFYIINIDSLGNKNWEKIVGGSGEEILKGAIASPNGFVLTGSSTSQTGKDKSENSFGKNDAWVVKFCIPPVSRITVNGDSVLCLGNSTMLEAPQGNYIYSWSNGAKTPSISVKDSGSYFVIVSDSSGCSAKSTPVKIKVQIPAQIIASGPLTFCAGGSVNLTASQGFSYTWSTGAQTNSIKVTSPGSYVVTVASACGILSAGPVSVIVNPLPGASISPSGNVYTCYNNLPLLAAGGGVSYVWSTGETTSSITANDDISYYVIAKDNNGCTKQSSFTNIYFDYPAFFTITNGDTVNCNGESIYLSPNPGATSYSWNTGSNIPVLSVTQSGTYQVTISNQCGTTTSLPRKITFYPYPLTSITGNHRACSGSPIQLSAHGAMTYKWSSGISSSDSVISDIPVLDKKYIVQGSNGPCSRNDTFLVKVDSLPLADFTYTVYGAKVTFGNISKASEKFKWFFGDGNTSVQKNPVHFYASDSIRTYTVSLIVYSDSCGSDTISYIFKAGLGEVSTFSGRGLSGTLEGPPNIAGFCIPMRIAYYPRSKKIFLIESAGFCGMFGSTIHMIKRLVRLR
ncbi:MAG: hypothetical protein HYU69_02105 [Bacteroidetes bacterium]|nr:hypothetical protein [Bacteroidota bacterium]